MNREERRLEKKSRGRRLKWLEKEAKGNTLIQKIVSEVEENFEDTELEAAKVFVADCLTQSGPFSEGNEEESIDETCQYYGLEAIDAMFLMDLIEEMLTAEKQPAEPESSVQGDT